MMTCTICGTPIDPSTPRVDLLIMVGTTERYTGISWHPACAPLERKHLLSEAACAQRAALDAAEGQAG